MKGAVAWLFFPGDNPHCVVDIWGDVFTPVKCPMKDKTVSQLARVINEPSLAGTLWEHTLFGSIKKRSNID